MNLENKTTYEQVFAFHPPKRSCKDCYGRGYTGKNVTVGDQQLCRCVVKQIRRRPVNLQELTSAIETRVKVEIPEFPLRRIEWFRYHDRAVTHFSFRSRDPENGPPHFGVDVSDVEMIKVNHETGPIARLIVDRAKALLEKAYPTANEENRGNSAA